MRIQNQIHVLLALSLLLAAADYVAFATSTGLAFVVLTMSLVMSGLATADAVARRDEARRESMARHPAGRHL